MGKGRVIGIDIEIRPQNRKAIETHELSPLITLVEGSSIASGVIERVKSFVKPKEAVIVVLDSDHSKRHVLAELEAYHDLINSKSYIIVADGIMKDLHDVPRGKLEWTWNNPATAATEFVQKHPEFVLEEPIWPFNESELRKNVTYCFAGWLRRK